MSPTIPLRAALLLSLGSLFTTELVEVTKGAERPNILFCIADDASYPHMGAYGCSWVNTPGFDRVAQEGLLFTRAYTPNAKCAPSRACILTGRNSWQLKEACNHWCDFPTEFKTYAEVLTEQGYFVGMTMKGWGPGVAKTNDGKPRLLAGTPFNKQKTQPPTKGISSNHYAANFAEFMEAAPQGEPWCFWYGSIEPHRGYEYRSGITQGGKRLDQIDRVPRFWPDNETTRTDLLDYAYEIDYFDSHLVQMLTLLEEKGMLENTIVVVTADNGMPFPRVKGQEYELSNHLPLAIMWPRGIKQPGRQIDDYVSFIDFTPTFLEAAGISQEASQMAPITGRSLLPIFRSEQSGQVDPARDHVLIGKERHDIGRPDDVGYPIRGIVKEGFLYLKNFETDRWPSGNPETGYLNCDGGPTKTVVLKSRLAMPDTQWWQLCFGKRVAEELYNVQADPECLHNLMDDPKFKTQADLLRQQLLTELTEQQDPRIVADGSIFDKYRYANPGERDFHTRYMKGEKINAGWVSPSDFESGP